MRTVIFISIFLLVVGFTSNSFAANPVITQLSEHDTDIKEDLGTLDGNREIEHGVLDAKLNQILSSATPSVPQPIQREFNAVIPGPDGVVSPIEAGRYTVPLGKRLIVEMITLHVSNNFVGGQHFYIFATTTIGSDTVKHSIGMNNVSQNSNSTSFSSPIAGMMESFQRTIYADQGTEIIFTVVTRSPGSEEPDGFPIVVTFSGKLIDVP